MTLCGFTCLHSSHLHYGLRKQSLTMMRIPFKTNSRALLLSRRSLSLYYETVIQKRNVSSVVLFSLCDWRQKEQRDKENDTNNSRRHFRRGLSSSGGGSWSSTRGHDITMESLKFGIRPKVIMEGYTPVGFHVYNTIKKMNNDNQDNQDADDGAFHLYGSIMAFPYGCFLWKVFDVNDITLESLYPVMLHRPAIECLFIGCNIQLPLYEMDRIRLAFLKQNIVVEQMNVGNAMGTFNILNAEDRQVAVALLVDSNSTAQ